MRLQEFIYKLEVGEGVWATRIVLSVLALLALTVWYDLHEFQNFRNAEAMEAAQLARNVARGEGYTTQCIRPLTIHLLQKKQGLDARLSRQPQPDLATPPVYPLVLAGLMKILPFRYEITARFWQYQPEMLIAVFNQGLFFLTVWLTYRLGRRLFDLPVALVAVAVLVGSDLLWRFSVSGLATCLLLVLFTVMLHTLARLAEAAGSVAETPPIAVPETGAGSAPPPTPTPTVVTPPAAPASRVALLAMVLGAVLGLGTLTRYAFGWLLIPVTGLAVAWLRGRRVLAGGLILLTFLLVVGPWVYRNYNLSGTLFGVQSFALYQNTVQFPETRLERSLDPDLGRVGAQDIARKLFTYAGDAVRNDVPRLGGGSWIGAFFLAALFLRLKSPVLGRLRQFMILCLLVWIVVQGLGHTHLSTDTPVVNSENLLVLLMPGIALFGTALFFVLLNHLDPAIQELRHLLALVFVGVASAPLITTLLPPRSYPIQYPPYLPPWIQESAQFLEKNELMMSDMPWAVAWYGNRSCVWTTLDVNKAFFAINDEQKTVSALYLTPITTDARFLTQVLQGPDDAWARFAVEVLTRTNLPVSFPLTHARRKYVPDQLLLCDRPRWQEPRRESP